MGLLGGIFLFCHVDFSPVLRLVLFCHVFGIRLKFRKPVSPALELRIDARLRPRHIEILGISNVCDLLLSWLAEFL